MSSSDSSLIFSSHLILSHLSSSLLVSSFTSYLLTLLFNISTDFFLISWLVSHFLSSFSLLFCFLFLVSLSLLYSSFFHILPVFWPSLMPFLVSSHLISSHLVSHWLTVFSFSPHHFLCLLFSLLLIYVQFLLSVFGFSSCRFFLYHLFAKTYFSSLLSLSHIVSFFFRSLYLIYFLLSICCLAS